MACFTIQTVTSKKGCSVSIPSRRAFSQLLSGNSFLKQTNASIAVVDSSSHYRLNCTIHKPSQSQLGETLSIAQASKKGRKRHKISYCTEKEDLNPTEQAI
jgi:hypothetical protein